MTAHNLDVIACILISLSVVVPLAVFVDRRVSRSLDRHKVSRLPDRSNVSTLHRRDGATVVRIDSGRGRAS